MLYLIHGNNIGKIKAKQNELVSIMQKKQPEVSLYKINEDGASLDLLSELLSSQGLFLAKYIVVLDRLLGSDVLDFITDNLANFKESDHAWIIIEEKVSAPHFKKIEKHAFKIFDFNEVSTGENGLDKKPRLTAFDFAEAVASKNKIMAWQEFQKLKNAELAGEEIHGVLWWQFKSMFLAMKSVDAKSAGLSPFVFQKSKRLGQAWDNKSFDEILNKMISIYHDAHRGEGDLMIELEGLVLRL